MNAQMIRAGHNDHIISFQRLDQQYVVDMYAKIKAEWLSFISKG
jgi:hypothetical protein